MELKEFYVIGVIRFNRKHPEKNTGLFNQMNFKTNKETLKDKKKIKFQNQKNSNSI